MLLIFAWSSKLLPPVNLLRFSAGSARVPLLRGPWRPLSGGGTLIGSYRRGFPKQIGSGQRCGTVLWNSAGFMLRGFDRIP